MKSAVWTSKSEVQLKELPIPEPYTPDEAVIKVLGCGICGTDVHIFHGEVPLAKPPVVLGHEIVGEIFKLGSGVKNLKVGDRICVDPVITCRKCEFCQSGRPNLCDNLTIIGYVRNGGFEQYTSIPRSHLYKISVEAGLKGGILVETLACVLNGYDRLGLKAGSSVLILGAGCVGLLWTQLIKHSVSTKIYQTEIVDMRRKVALELGVDDAINPKKDNLAKRVKNCSPNGVDYIIDATGSASAIQEALPLLKKGGTLMVFGVCPSIETLKISPFDIFNNEWTILGGKMPPYKLTRAVKIVEAGIIDSDRLVTNILPLREIKKGFKWFTDAPNKVIKMMIDPWM